MAVKPPPFLRCGEPAIDSIENGIYTLRARLLAARKRCRIGDVLSPDGAAWNAERARS